MRTVLVTGFEPFGEDSTNPSWLAVQALAARWSDDDVNLHVAELPCVYGRAIEVLAAEIARCEPELVVSVGQAGGRFAVTPERVAVNVNDARIPDNAGATPVDEPVVPGGPVGYWTGLPVKACVQALRRSDIPAEVSQSAGTFVCNDLFYGLMHLVATQRPALRAGFVHVPFSHDQVTGRAWVPSLSLLTITDAVEVVVRTSLSTEADIAESGGAIS